MKTIVFAAVAILVPALSFAGDNGALGQLAPRAALEVPAGPAPAAEAAEGDDALETLLRGGRSKSRASGTILGEMQKRFNKAKPATARNLDGIKLGALVWEEDGFEDFDMVFMAGLGMVQEPAVEGQEPASFYRVFMVKEENIFFDEDLLRLLEAAKQPGFTGSVSKITLPGAVGGVYSGSDKNWDVEYRLDNYKGDKYIIARFSSGGKVMFAACAKPK